MQPLYIYTIYDHPRDHPNHFVVRRRIIGKGIVTIDMEYLVLSDSLQQARESLPAHLVFIGREQQDDPVIVESYI
jgi:hypothetical protein